MIRHQDTEIPGLFAVSVLRRLSQRTPIRHQATTQTDADLLSVRHLKKQNSVKFKSKYKGSFSIKLIWKCGLQDISCSGFNMLHKHFLCSKQGHLTRFPWHRQVINRHHIVYVTFDQVYTVSLDTDRSSTDIISLCNIRSGLHVYIVYPDIIRSSTDIISSMQHSIRSPLCFLTSTDHQQTSHRLCSIRTGRSTLWLLTSTYHQQISYRLCNIRSGLHCLLTSTDHQQTPHRLCNIRSGLPCDSWYRQTISRHHIVYATFDQVCNVSPDIDRSWTDVISSM